MTKIMMSAGEISGDVHGAKLVLEIKKIDSSITFFGMGSVRMAQAGVTLFADISSISTIGFIEPIKHIPRLFYTYLHMKRLLKQEKPDLLIPIDFQGYHMLLIKAAKKLGIPVIYYIAPQEWQWGTVKGGQAVVKFTNKILSIFPQEAEFYNQLGGNAVYVGHPILDLAVSSMDKATFCQKYQIDPAKRIISVFPGSRPQELKRIFPILIQAASQLQQQFTDIQWVVSVVSKDYLNQIQSVVQNMGLTNVIFYFDNPYNLIANTHLSLVSSGTITLEHACLGTPCIVNYQFSKFSFWLAKTLFPVRFKRIKYVALPNIILDQKILPEFIQENCNAENIVKTAIPLLTNQTQYLNMKKNLLKVKAKMGLPGVVARAAKEIFGFLGLN